MSQVADGKHEVKTEFHASGVLMSRTTPHERHEEWDDKGQLLLRSVRWEMMYTVEILSPNGLLLSFETLTYYGCICHGTIIKRKGDVDPELSIEYYICGRRSDKQHYDKELTKLGKSVTTFACLAENGLGLLVAQYCDLPPPPSEEGSVDPRFSRPKLFN